MPYKNMKDPEYERKHYGEVQYRLAQVAAARGMPDLNDLARATKMNPWVLRQCAAGAKFPSQEQIARVCTVLKCTVADLLVFVPAQNADIYTGTWPLGQ